MFLNLRGLGCPGKQLHNGFPDGFRTRISLCCSAAPPCAATTPRRLRPSPDHSASFSEREQRRFPPGACFACSCFQIDVDFSMFSPSARPHRSQEQAPGVPEPSPPRISPSWAGGRDGRAPVELSGSPSAASASLPTARCGAARLSGNNPARRSAPFPLSPAARLIPARFISLVRLLARF